MYKIYLSGPIAGLTYQGANDWREYVEGKIHVEDMHGMIKANEHITLLNPMRCKEFLDGQGIINETMVENNKAQSDIVRDEFIGMRDHWDTFRSDLMIVNVLGAEIVSIGTMIEIGIAYHARVPIFLVIEDEGNVHDHCMVRAYSTMRFNDLNRAVEAANALLSV